MGAFGVQPWGVDQVLSLFGGEEWRVAGRLFSWWGWPYPHPQTSPRRHVALPGVWRVRQLLQGQDEVVKEKGTAKEEELFYMKQFIPNACGTIGIIHALGNNVAQVDLADGTLLRQFLDSVRGKDPEAIGEELEKFQSIATAHEEIANEGQTAAPNREDQILTHFVTFVHSNGNLFELDGRRKGPVNHGPTTPENLIKDAAVVCKARMERDPTEYRFTVVALTTGSIE